MVVRELGPVEALKGIEQAIARGGFGGGRLGHHQRHARPRVGLGGAGAMVGALGADAGDREEGLKRTGRVGFLHGALLPLRERLVFEHGAGGPANVAVGAVQVRPGQLDGLRVLHAVEGFELMAELGLGVDALERTDTGGALLADVADAVEARLHLAAADGEIHRAILGVDERIGHGQGSAGHELFLRGGVAGALRGEVDGVDLAPAPIEGIEGLLVLGRELGAVAEGHARRRTGADVEGGR